MSEKLLQIPNMARWPAKRLDAICDLISRGKGPTYVDASSVLAIGQRCITEQGFDPSNTRPHDPRVISGHLFPRLGDVLLNSTGTGTIGRSAVFDAEGDFIVDSHVTVLRPRNSVTNGKWLDSVIRTSWGQNHLERYCYTGSTNQIELSRSQLANTAVPVPTYPEQRKIAQILDTLDTQIRKTEALIAKLERTKEGLLTDLLTRGIDENGQLRPAPDEAPHLYKNTPLGWIPRDWKVERLGTLIERWGGLIQTGPFGSQLHADEYVAHGVPVVMPQNMRNIEVSIDNIAHITERRARDLSRHRVQINDLIFSRRGDLTRCSFISSQNEGWLCGTGCLLVRPPASVINGYWLAHAYKQPSVQSQVLGMAVGSTMVNLNSSILASLLLPLPCIEEQKVFEKEMRAANKRVELEKAELKKLLTEKNGLMDDLLTGRIRVTPLLEPSEEAHA